MKQIRVFSVYENYVFESRSKIFTLRVPPAPPALTLKLTSKMIPNRSIGPIHYHQIPTLFLILHYLIELNFGCIANPLAIIQISTEAHKMALSTLNADRKRRNPQKRYDNLDARVNASREAWDTLRLAFGRQ
jgi:hypothetical protein